MTRWMMKWWSQTRWGGHAGTDAWLIVYFGALIGFYVKCAYLSGRLGAALQAEHPWPHRQRARGGKALSKPRASQPGQRVDEWSRQQPEQEWRRLQPWLWC